MTRTVVFADFIQCTGPFDHPTFEYDSEKTRMCSCSAATRLGTNCTGTTTRARTGARTTWSASASRSSFSDNGITSQKVSVKSNGVWAIEQKFAYVRGSPGWSSGTIVKLICLRCGVSSAIDANTSPPAQEREPVEFAEVVEV